MNGSDFVAALARSSLAASVLVLLVLLTQRVFRRQLSPFWNCTLWFLVAARLLPFSLSSAVSIFNWVPTWPQPPATGQAAVSPTIDLANALTAKAPGASTTAAPNETAADAERSAQTAGSIGAQWLAAPAAALFWAWLAGALALVGAVIVSTVSLARATAQARPVCDAAVLARLRECGAALGLHRVPELVESSAVTTPALAGLIRPRVLLPPGFLSHFDAAEQRFVFLHELAHLRRRDLWLNWLMTALQILHWFNPLVWFAFARWRNDREIACDAAALGAAGGDHSRGYGETMLRLLENFVAPSRRPGLVGILEDNRQLRRRMRLIASFTSTRRPFAAAGLVGILAVVGLTDAQVPGPEAPAAPTAVAQRPVPAKAHVLLLVDSTVNAGLVEDVWQTQSRGANVRLESFSNVAEFSARLEQLGNTELERIVLLTGGLPRTSGATESDPIAEWKAALRPLPPRTPVHTILVSGARTESAAAGMFWELAHATRGQFTTLPRTTSEPLTHLAFVLDTSGSMRDPNTGGVWPTVLNAIETTLDAQPQLVGVQLIDGDGRFILGRRGTGAAGWLPNTADTRATMLKWLRSYNQDTVSNPVAGVANAIRFLDDKRGAMRMGIYILGDEFVAAEATSVLEQIATLNPPEAGTGRRPITISAIGFPTTIRFQFSMGNTGLRFADLMRQITGEHGGAFIGLPEL